jgi:hypothetical protein
MVARTRNPHRIPRRLLVFLDRTNALHGKAAGLSIRVGPARPRPHRPWHDRRNAHPFGKLRSQNEEAVSGTGFSLWSLVLAKPKIHRLKPVPPRASTAQPTISNSLKKNRDPLPNANAHGCQRVVPFDPLKLPRRRQNNPRPAHPQRMSQRDRTAIGIHFLASVRQS